MFKLKNNTLNKIVLAFGLSLPISSFAQEVKNEVHYLCETENICDIADINLSISDYIDKISFIINNLTDELIMYEVEKIKPSNKNRDIEEIQKSIDELEKLIDSLKHINSKFIQLSQNNKGERKYAEYIEQYNSLVTEYDNATKLKEHDLGEADIKYQINTINESIREIEVSNIDSEEKKYILDKLEEIKRKNYYILNIVNNIKDKYKDRLDETFEQLIVEYNLIMIRYYEQ